MPQQCSVDRKDDQNRQRVKWVLHGSKKKLRKKNQIFFWKDIKFKLYKKSNIKDYPFCCSCLKKYIIYECLVASMGAFAKKKIISSFLLLLIMMIFRKRVPSKNVGYVCFNR